MNHIYQALAYQMPCHAINGVTERQAHMTQHIERLTARLKAAKAFIGADLKLVCLPEYFLTGYPMGESVEEWRAKACLEMDGFEYEQLGRIAQDLNIYLCGNAYEQDPHFNGLYFQCSFIIAPNGNVILRYRRLHSLYSPTPYDVLDLYLEIYGYNSLFPVVETDIGCLSALASEEILFPEVARMFNFQGAQILLHPTSQAARQDLCPKAICAQARAIENMMFVISANTGGLYGSDMAPQAADCGSRIIDFKGQISCASESGDSIAAFAHIDLNAQNHARSRPSMENLYARGKPQLYARAYENALSAAANQFLKDGKVAVPDRRDFLRLLQDRLSDIQTSKPLSIS